MDKKVDSKETDSREMDIKVEMESKVSKGIDSKDDRGDVQGSRVGIDPPQPQDPAVVQLVPAVPEPTHPQTSGPLTHLAVPVTPEATGPQAPVLSKPTVAMTPNPTQTQRPYREGDLFSLRVVKHQNPDRRSTVSLHPVQTTIEADESLIRDDGYPWFLPTGSDENVGKRSAFQGNEDTTYVCTFSVSLFVLSPISHES
jgi:hypothetical protein